MTAPDPGLTDLVAAHTLRVVELNEAARYPECNGCDWVGGLVKDHAVHLASVVEQHANGRIAELEATIARVENSLPEAPSTGFNPTLSEFDRGYERGQQVAVEYVQSAIKGDDSPATLEGERQ